MKKIKINAVNNILMFVFFIPVVVSGIVLKYQLPSKNRGGEIFWSWQRHDWLFIHDVFSLMVTILVIVHLLLHLQWLKSLPKLLRIQDKSKKE